jgi:hypothetical protein
MGRVTRLLLADDGSKCNAKGEGGPNQCSRATASKCLRGFEVEPGLRALLGSCEK